jgi:hypothetical protein
VQPTALGKKIISPKKMKPFFIVLKPYRVQDQQAGEHREWRL